MLSQVWREFKRYLRPAIAKVNEQEKRIELIGGGLIDFWSLEVPDASRGRKYARVVIDEAAAVRGLADAWAEVIRATLADYRGDAWFLSTPKGLNDFYRFYMRAGDEKDWARWKMPTSCNPHIHPGEIDAMRAELPERVYRQEILAEFVEDGSYFQNVEAACTIAQPDTPAQHHGHYMAAGVDWANSGDYTVITVACRECAKVVDWWRGNQTGYIYQRQQLAGMVEKWKASVLPERNSIGEPNIELLRADGLRILTGLDHKPGWLTTATSKAVLIQGLAAALETGQFTAPVDYADELRSYEMEVGTTNMKFSAPSGQHDDRVISLALAWRAITTGQIVLGEL